MKKLAYIVELRYYKYKFDTAEEAMAFANTAKEHAVEDGSVEIAVVFDDEEE